MILHRTISQLVIICLITQVGFGQSSHRNQLEALVGERPEVETPHTVREAAQEYIAAYWALGKEEEAIQAYEIAASVLFSQESRQATIDGYSSMVFSVWCISVATSEALYDLEAGDVTRRLMKKLSAVKEGRDPLFETTNGAE